MSYLGDENYFWKLSDSNNSIFNIFCDTPFWDSNLTWATNEPDLTPCFKSTVLIWIPCGFLFLFTPLELYNIFQSKYSNIPWNFLNISRLVISILLIGICLMDLIINNFSISCLVDILATIFKIASFLLSACLQVLHKKYGIVSSGLQFLFWFLLWIMAIPQLLSEIKAIRQQMPIEFETSLQSSIEIYYKYIPYVTYFGLISLQLFSHCFADKRPRKSKYNDQTNDTVGGCLEIQSSFLQKIFFAWFEPTTWKGYRTPLTIDDVHALNPEYRSSEVSIPFQRQWQKSINRNKNRQSNDCGGNGNEESSQSVKTNGSIVPAMLKAFWGKFWFISILKLIMDLMNFTRPFILGLLINFTTNNEPIWHGFIYMALMWSISIFTALMNGQIFQLTYLIGFKTKTALIDTIFRKVLTISNSAKNDISVGQIHNLMAVDAQRFMDLSSYLHALWSGPIVICLAIFFLWQILGIAVFAGLLVLIVLVPVNAFVAARLKRLQVKQMKKKDERIKMMNEILNGIKVLKLYAWELSFEQNVLDVRSKEMQLIKTTAYYNTVNYISWTIAPYLVTLLSFATYVLIDENNVLDARTAFVSLTLFGILKQPLIFFPMAISNLIQSIVAVTRINNFLNSEDLEETKENIQQYEEFPIKLENASFSWDGQEKSLEDIDLTVRNGELVAIVGVVGSGKSTLISSILGETKKLAGQVNVSGSIAYIAQQAWIRNATIQVVDFSGSVFNIFLIKDNILFGSPLNQEFYDQVIEACALLPDLKFLPSGDQTEIGERGINLSGGQKQRVSLARAIYRQADTYLLDDPLSAVDAHVGKHIFDQVIGPNGLLAGKTRILVTHGITYLPQVSTIYVLKNGRITETGGYEQLLERKGEFADFIEQYSGEKEDEKEEKKQRPRKRTKENPNNPSREPPKSGQLRQRPRTTQQKPDASGKLIKKEESKIESVNFQVYLNYLKSVGILFVSITIIGSIGYHSLSVYGNIWLSQWTDDPQSIIPHIRDMYLGIYGGIGFFQAFSMSIMAISMAIGCLYAAQDIHNNLLRQTLKLPMSFFETNPLGRIVNRFAMDVNIVDTMIPLSIRLWIGTVFSVISVFIVISISTPPFLFVIIPLIFAYGFVQRFFVTTSRQLKRIQSIARSPVFSHFGETITGNTTIRAHKAEKQFIAEAEAKIDLNQKCSYATMIANRWLALRLEFIGSFVILFAIWLAILQRDNISGAIVGLSINYALQITSVLNFLVRTTSELQTNIVANERLDEYNHEKKEADWIGKSVDSTWPSQGRIEFKDYSVRYREGLDIVLKGISFNVEPKEKIGIVGRTGAGKSSLTLGLFRILEPAGGSISIDNVDITELGLHTLRSRLAVIPQDPVLFCGSIRMNIDPLHQYTDADIWTALKHAYLKDFVAQTSKGLDHEINEGGENLSVGQRQLICLARALLTKAKILVMDEATAAVDLETDDLIQKTIRSQFVHCTILTVAHRLNTILDSDRVLVLDDGRIVEYESPALLLNNKDSVFFKMAKDAGIVNCSD